MANSNPQPEAKIRIADNRKPEIVEVQFTQQSIQINGRILKSMAKQEPIVVTGKITQVLPGTMFRVVLSNGHEVLV